ncbi:MAG TPA: hypothetical protein VIU85_10115 [Chthoniobacterales bacterium]
MKKCALLQFALAICVAGLAFPAFAKTMSIPSDASPAYTVEIPNDWNPKIADETLEATEPDNHVYVSGWIVTKSDVNDLKKDLGDLLKEEMKTIDGNPTEETMDTNGIKFMVLRGHGKDKREGTDVKFLVTIFPAGEGKAGVFYADWDADAPSDITKKLNDLMNSIKLHK